MPDQSPDAQDRVSTDVAPKPRHLMAGLALPTAAAVALMFVATGAAAATATHSPSAPSSQSATAVTLALPVAVDPTVLQARRLKAMAHSQAVTRGAAAARAARSARAAATVARSVKRIKLAIRVQQAKDARVLKAERATATLRANRAAATRAANRAEATRAANRAVATRAANRAAATRTANRAAATRTANYAAAARTANRVTANRSASTSTATSAGSANGWQLPITNPVKTSGFGYRWGRLHAGEDFGVPVGTPLASMSSGTVSYAGPMSGYGNIVQIRYWDGTISYYGHMSTISVNVGQSVARGEIIGQSGNTGHSTGPHLHLEIHPNGGPAIDPLPWLANHNIAP